MMAVSASGASSEPLASWVRYVPVEGESGNSGGMNSEESDGGKKERRNNIAEAIKGKHFEM